MLYDRFRVLRRVDLVLCIALMGCAGVEPDESSRSTRVVQSAVTVSDATGASQVDSSSAGDLWASVPSWTQELLEIGPDVPLNGDQIELCKWPMIMSPNPQWQQRGWTCCDAWTAWVMVGIPTTRRDCGCLLPGE